MSKFFTLFLVLLVILFALELWAPVQVAVIMPWTEFLSFLSVSAITLFDDNVVASGNVIRSTVSGFAVSIEPGCNGVEAVIVLVAAILAFPAPLRYKANGLLIGIFAIMVLNLLRILTLFYLGQWHQGMFEWAHLYVWPVLIILDALIVFVIWIQWMPPSHVATESAPGH
jgi:exosortase H (IPTLxxWG-CTERM-specific)